MICPKNVQLKLCLDDSILEVWYIKVDTILQFLDIHKYSMRSVHATKHHPLKNRNYEEGHTSLINRWERGWYKVISGENGIHALVPSQSRLSRSQVAILQVFFGIMKLIVVCSSSNNVALGYLISKSIQINLNVILEGSFERQGKLFVFHFPKTTLLMSPVALFFSLSVQNWTVHVNISGILSFDEPYYYYHYQPQKHTEHRRRNPDQYLRTSTSRPGHRKRRW